MKYLSVLSLFFFLFAAGSSLQAQSNTCEECYQHAEVTFWQCQSRAQFTYWSANAQCDYLYCNPDSPYGNGIHYLCVDYYYDFCQFAAETNLEIDLIYCELAYWDYIDYCEEYVCFTPSNDEG